jgi:peptidoglycan/xylan/chitin deacetylase (PgdA/CDA1 family)
VGTHTETHPVLSQLAVEGQRDEIRRAVAAVEAWTGRRPRAFAYPTGRRGRDYDERTIREVAAAGVEAAFTTEPGWSSAARPPLEQPRFVMVDGLDGAELDYRLAWHWRAGVPAARFLRGGVP